MHELANEAAERLRGDYPDNNVSVRRGIFPPTCSHGGESYLAVCIRLSDYERECYHFYLDTFEDHDLG